MLNVPGMMGIEGKLEVSVRRSVRCKYNRLCQDLDDLGDLDDLIR